VIGARAYYNEIEPFAADWLRNLMLAGHIMDGEVDTRSIVEVQPDDLKGFTRCHFFAGIGGWDFALRLADWPTERLVWTGSCPCQPFSVAGRGAGVADERHLWPAWFRLIRECRPGVVFGEQVEAAIRHGWLDVVQADMEEEGYAVGAVGLPAAGFGAPHIRQRLWFVADAGGGGIRRGREYREDAGAPREVSKEVREQRLRLDAGADGRLADNAEQGWRAQPQRATEPNWRPPQESGRLRDAGELGDADDARLQERERDGRVQREALGAQAGQAVERGSDAGFWSNYDWIPCRDGKARPVEPGTFPLAHGISSRMGRLRAYGNAIVPQVAAEVIRAYMECLP